MASEPDMRIRIKGDAATKTLIIEGTPTPCWKRARAPSLMHSHRLPGFILLPTRHVHRHDQGGAD
jgi:hypothetical protein